MLWIILILLAWAVILGIAIAKRRKKVKGLTTKHDEHGKEGHGESTLSTIKHLPWPVIFGALLVICTIWTFADYRPGETAFVWNGFWGLETSAQFLIGLALIGLIVWIITSALKGEHGSAHAAHQGGHTHKESIFSLSAKVWGALLAIVFVPIIAYFVIMNWGEIHHALLGNNPGTRELVGTYEISPNGKAVQTVSVKDFELETDGRAVLINYSGTKVFVPYQAHDEVTEDETTLPPGAHAGPLHIKSNGETTSFKVRLYKIIQ